MRAQSFMKVKSYNLVKGRTDMKRVFIAALAMAFLLSLAACGSTPSESQTPAGSTPAQTEAPGAGGTEKSNFPEKTITIVVPYDAGGASDLMSRVFAAALSEQLNGATVVVENRSGGSGAVGMEYVNSQPSDGYTILYLETNQTMIRHYGFTELEPSAFIQMACTHVQPAVLAVSAGSEWNSLEDFIDYAKENPGKVSIGDAGTGSSPHMCGVQLAAMAEAEFNFVPYDGGATAVSAAMGGNVDAVIAQNSEALAGVDSGDLRVIATFGQSRTSLYPDVPTAAEQGYSLDCLGWGGFAVKADTPQEIVDILAPAAYTAAQSQGVQDLCSEKGYDFTPRDLEESMTFVSEQVEYYNQLFASMEQS